jgi:hypothetical protein
VANKKTSVQSPLLRDKMKAQVKKILDKGVIREMAPCLPRPS